MPLDGGFDITVVPEGHRSGFAMQSVGLVLVSPSGKLFVFQELRSNPKIGKAQGNWSFPWETREAGESDEGTLARLCHEEVHRGLQLKHPPRFLTAFEFAESYATFYWTKIMPFHEFLGSAVLSNEITPGQWLRPVEMMTRTSRVGISQVLLALREASIGCWSVSD